MRKLLPCPKKAQHEGGGGGCKDGAGLKTRSGFIPYEMGRPPSAFLTKGKPFHYRCMRCGAEHSISQMGFAALLDRDLPPAA